MTPYCAVSGAGLGNRLKCYWSARRLHPDSVLIWPRDCVWGVKDNIGVPAIEPFTDLFADASRLVESPPDGYHQWYDWKLHPFPEDGVEALDFLYHKTPKTAIDAYLPIVKSTIPSTDVLELADKYPAQPYGIHIRTKFDAECWEGMHHRLDWRQYPDKLKSYRPCYLATDCIPLKEAMRNEPGVYICDAVDMTKMVVGDWKSALAEMLVLSKCDQLVINYSGSTFVEAAWWLGGAKQPVTWV